MQPIIFSILVFTLFLINPAFAESGGEAVYNKACASCHNNGVAGAPKLGDKEAWEPLLAEEMSVLYQSAIKGKGVMPAKGGHKTLTDDEVKAAVDYMVEESK